MFVKRTNSTDQCSATCVGNSGTGSLLEYAQNLTEPVTCLFAMNVTNQETQLTEAEYRSSIALSLTSKKC